MENQTSLGALLGSTVSQAKRLASAQAALVKAELQQTGQNVAKVSIFGLVAIGAVSTAGLFLLVAAALGLVAAGLAPWLSFLIVAGGLILVAVIAGLIAANNAKKIRGPRIATEELEKTQQAIAQSVNNH
ncbi:MAG: phage holin family protein [Actinomycetota bacterium]